jgi:deoxyhypusine synthase
MKKVKDFLWEPGMSVENCFHSFSSIGFQATELYEAAEVILKMRRSGAKIFLTFTSNMVTSGLRGFFSQLIRLGLVDIIVTTSGSIEEDIMKSFGEDFGICKFSYMRFEDEIKRYLEEIYKKNTRITGSELLKEIGFMIKDENSILYQASKNNIPVFCPGIADSSFGFHLFLFQQSHKDFLVDTIGDMREIITNLSFDEKKGLIALGGSISKHYAIFSSLLSGGLDYAVYMTTSHQSSGSISGATTQEAKSWGKIRDDAEAATVIGDVSINFPIMMTYVLDKLKKENLLK